MSPTMKHGNIATWNKAVGDSLAAGDSICSVETDKATVDFEATDDGFVAKILVEEGTADIDIGTPILIVVEEEEDVAAFADYEPPVTAAVPAADMDEHHLLLKKLGQTHCRPRKPLCDGCPARQDCQTGGVTG